MSAFSGAPSSGYELDLPIRQTILAYRSKVMVIIGPARYGYRGRTKGRLNGFVGSDGIQNVWNGSALGDADDPDKHRNDNRDWVPYDYANDGQYNG